MIICKDIDFSKGLTEEQLEMLRKLENVTGVPDEDCPEATHEQLVQAVRERRHRQWAEQMRQTVDIKLSEKALEKAKSLGDGYTVILSRILEAALADNEILKQYM